jgi:hypothetical protein
MLLCLTEGWTCPFTYKLHSERDDHDGLAHRLLVACPEQ